MRNPLPAAHELVVDALAKGVAHAAVIAGEAYTAAYGGREVLDLLLLDLRHRDDRHDQAHVDDARIGKSFGRVLNIDFEALAFENLGEDMGALFRLVAAPAAPDNQRFAHLFPPCCSSRLNGMGAAQAASKLTIWRCRSPAIDHLPRVNRVRRS